MLSFQNSILTVLVMFLPLAIQGQTLSELASNADAAANRGDHEQALKYQRQILSKIGNNYPKQKAIVCGSMAFSQLYLDQPKAALSNLRIALGYSGHPPAEKAKLLCIEGRAYANLEQYERAIQSFNDAILLVPSDPEFYHQRAFARHDLSKINPDAASEADYCADFEKAASLGHKDAAEAIDLICK